MERTYETITDAVQDLNARGYISDFLLLVEKECLRDKISNISLSPDEFEIDETYRFEGETDPGDEMILFAISSKKNHMKGIIVNAYGMYADSVSSNIVKRLKTHLNNEPQ